LGKQGIEALEQVIRKHHFFGGSRWNKGWEMIGSPSISSLPRIKGPNTPTQAVEKETPMSNVAGHPVS